MNTPPEPTWWIDTYVKIVKQLETGKPYKPRGGKFVNYEGTMGAYVNEKVKDAYDQDVPIVDACRSWYSGAYLLETVPSAIYILMKHGDDPEEAIVRAVNDTKDNDTIAAIVGAAVGALHGKEKLPKRWISNLLGRTSSYNDGHIFQLLMEAKRLWYSAKPFKRTNYKSQENVFSVKFLSTISIESGKLSDNCEMVIKKNMVMGNIAEKPIFSEPLIIDDFFTTFEQIQNQLKFMHLSLRVCGQCQYFGFSSMSYQMSGGETGYCTLIKDLNVDRDDVVHILDSCDAFRHRKKKTEYSPWLPA